jgi:hypothetical protein
LRLVAQRKKVEPMHGRRTRLLAHDPAPVPRERSRPRQVPALAIGAQALGAFAIGTIALGAIAVSALAIARLAVGKARIRHLHIDELVVRRVHVVEQLSLPSDATAERATDRASR